MPCLPVGSCGSVSLNLLFVWTVDCTSSYWLLWSDVQCLLNFSLCEVWFPVTVDYYVDQIIVSFSLVCVVFFFLCFVLSVGIFAYEVCTLRAYYPTFTLAMVGGRNEKIFKFTTVSTIFLVQFLGIIKLQSDCSGLLNNLSTLNYF